MNGHGNGFDIRLTAAAAREALDSPLAGRHLETCQLG
jgi:hypothetical protein